MKMLWILAAMSVLTACGSQLYRDTDTAQLSGLLDVRWVNNDYFLFIPNPDDPLTLTRADGTTIQPGVMYTDGGSVPRFLWGVPGLSPWGYAPAYMMHDWLFVAQHCEFEPDNQYSFEDSIDVIAEALKAIMVDNPDARNYFAFDGIVLATGTTIARNLWDRGACNSPEDDLQISGLDRMPANSLPGELITTLDFSN